MISIVPCGGIFEGSTLVTSLSMVKVASHILWTTYFDALATAKCYNKLQRLEVDRRAMERLDILHWTL